MKNAGLIIIFPIFLLLTVSYPVLAQTDYPLVTKSEENTGRNILLPQKESSGSISQSKSFLNSTVKTLITRIEAGVKRLEKISVKFASRIQKISSPDLTAKDRAKLKSVSGKYDNLNEQMEKIKTDLSKLEAASATVTASVNPKRDYPVFRNQFVSLSLQIKDMLVRQSSLMSEIKQLPSASATTSGKTLPNKK